MLSGSCPAPASLGAGRPAPRRRPAPRPAPRRRPAPSGTSGARLHYDRENQWFLSTGFWSRTGPRPAPLEPDGPLSGSSGGCSVSMGICATLLITPECLKCIMGPRNARHYLLRLQCPHNISMCSAKLGVCPVQHDPATTHGVVLQLGKVEKGSRNLFVGYRMFL